MTKDFKADYDASDIATLYQQRKDDGEESRVRALIATLREHCRLEHEVSIPGEYKAISKEIRTPFIRDAAFRIAASMLAKPPVPHVEPKDQRRKEYREAASIAERFDAAMIERFNEEQSTDIQFNSTYQHVRDGESVLKVVHKPDAWAAFPDGVSVDKQDAYKRGAAFPIAWRDVDRLCVLYEDGEYGDEWILEYGEYATPFLRSKYQMVDVAGRLTDPANVIAGKPWPEGLLSSSRGRKTKIEFLTTREWHVIVDGTEAPGWPKPNPYAPYLNYFRAKAFDGESLLYSLLFLVPRMDELLTMKLNWGVLGAYPNPVIETDASAAMMGLDSQGAVGDIAPSTAGDLGKPAANKVVWKPGKAIELPPGQKISFLIPPPVGKDLNELAQMLKGLIDIAGVPSILRGGISNSGYEAAQMRAAAEMAYKTSALALQRQQKCALDFSHYLIDRKVKQTVYVQGWSARNPKTFKPAKDAERVWLGMSPDETKKSNIATVSMLGPTSMQYRSMIATDAQANAMIAMQLTNAQNPLMGVRDALEKYLQEEDPDQIMENMEIEAAMKQEPLHSIILGKALEDAGLLPHAQPGTPAPSPASQLVGTNGQPLTQGAGQASGVPMDQGTAAGMPQVAGVNMPIVPEGNANQSGSSVPGMVGGRRPGMYPGQPGGPGNG